MTSTLPAPQGWMRHHRLQNEMAAGFCYTRSTTDDERERERERELLALSHRHKASGAGNCHPDLFRVSVVVQQYASCANKDMFGYLVLTPEYKLLIDKWRLLMGKRLYSIASREPSVRHKP